MRLITYLPMSRLNDLVEYFVANIELLRPNHIMIFIDNVRDCKYANPPLSNEYDTKYVCINYGNRSETVLNILESVDRGDVVVDSDVVLDKSFTKIYEKAINMNTKLIGIADVNGKPSIRDVVKDGIPYTRILYAKRGHSPVFFGPKQALIINHAPDGDVVNTLRSILHDVPRTIRNCIADETVLGLYALLIGQTTTPWFPAAYNAGSSEDACGRKLRAYAYYVLFKSLIRHSIHIEGLNNYLQLIRYKLSWVL